MVLIEYMIEFAIGRKWLPDLADMLKNNWQPVELARTLAVALASGKYNALTGRWVSAEDNLDEMLRRIAEIEKDELCVWTVRGLKKTAE